MSEQTSPAGIERAPDGVGRASLGKTVFWNASPSDLTCPLVDSRPPTFLELDNAIITPRKIDAKIDDRKKVRLRFATGGVYDQNLRIIPAFPEREAFEESANKRNRLRNDATLGEERLDGAIRLEGSYVYLGILRTHFGHFLLESMSRIWFLLRDRPNAKVIVHISEGLGNLPSYVRHFLKLVDLEPDRLVTVTQTCVVEHLIFPESEFEIRWKAHQTYSDSFAELYDRNSRLFAKGQMPQQAYLTRRQLVAKEKDRKKRVVNEDQIEDLFRSRGYEIIAPEKLPMQEQIALAGEAQQIAGLKGSALHMSLFNQRANARLIQVDVNQSMNQCLIDALKRMESHHIFCQSSPSTDGSKVDIDLLHDVLRQM